ncbi:MAG: nucleoside-diphosphate sugar epimerase/dehydratase, partial [Acidimicrobiia bacterium]
MGGVVNGANGRGQLSLSRTASRIRTDIAFAVIDLVVVMAAYSIGLGLRTLDPLVGHVQDFWIDLAIALPFIAAIHLTANALAGAYGHVWEYASMSEAVRMVIASASASATILTIAVLARERLGLIVPFGTLVLGGLLSLLMMGLVRFRSRLFSYRKSSDGPSILVVGQGLDAVAFARRAQEIDGGGRVVGFISEENSNSRPTRLLADLPVFGGIDDLASVIEDEDIDQVVVVSSDPDQARAVVDACLEVDVRLRILPAVEELLRDWRAPLDVRDIKVDDLLIRDPVATDMTAIGDVIEGKRVLVTGAGGSIGSEIVRQVLTFQPESVWALDRDETLLHEARLRWPGSVNVVLADIREAATVLRNFERIHPHVVFHAAALKHVPVLENYPEEAVLTNVVGTRNVIEAGSRVGVKRFVLISTDKAVDPSSIMGATKRVAEILVKSGNARNDGCLYTAVRFGNVLGSRGSVIPTFVSQIRSGGPVTVTDKGMTRYFMTVDEAVQLVLQAAGLARESEVFLLDMGDPVRIEDLARRLIRLAGLIPDVDIQIEYTGIRPGEKLVEQLTTGPVQTTAHPKIFEVPLTHPDA